MSTLEPHLINEPLTKITWIQLETFVAADVWVAAPDCEAAAGGGLCLTNTQCRA